jgi:hypothetical protein
MVWMVLILSTFNASAQLNSQLPIVVINTNGQEIIDEPKIEANMSIVFDTTGGINSSNGPFNVYDGKIGIELRGNSSQTFTKKAYGVQLWSSANTPVEQELLGMNADADWALHAMYIDKSLIRVPLSFYLFEQMGHYATRWRYVEVILNNENIGVYALMEKIEQGANRVDIDSLGAIDNSGGYILRIDWDEGGRGVESEYPSMEGEKMLFQYHYPKNSQLEDGQKDYIKTYMDRFEDAVFSDDFTNGQGEHFSQLADMETFADFLLINELSKNSDGYKLSTYIRKDNDAFDGRLKAGPIWDFDQTFGMSNVCSGDHICGWNFLQNQEGCEDLTTMPLWWENFTRDPAFCDLLVQRWNAFRADALHTDSINEWIDQRVIELDGARQRNFERWQILGQIIWAEAEPVRPDYDAEIVFLKEWTQKRAEWMDRNITSIHSIVTADNHVEIYPNPASDIANVSIIPGSTVRICDLTGRQIWNSGVCSESTYSVNTSGWALGCYVVYVHSTRGVFSGKLIVR